MFSTWSDSWYGKCRLRTWTLESMSRISPVRRGQREHGADAAGTEALDPISQFIVDVGCGHHGLVALWPGPIHNAAKDSPLPFVEEPAVAFSRLLAVTLPVLSTVAFWGFLGESSSHSKTSVFWNSDDVFVHPLFQNLRGFSSLF